MPVAPKNHPRLLPVAGTAMAIVAATLIANRLTGTPQETRPQLASQPAAEPSPEKAAPPSKPRERYQATIENWRRYRATNAPD